MTKKFWACLLILVLAVVLRIYDFGANPAGVYVDEASHGYSAYSLLQTGRDEFGKAWPILFRSFGTYPPGLYNYLTVLPVKLLGLNAISVRITSLIFGIFLVILALIINTRFGLVVALAPVFVFVSRAAFEPNLGLVLLFLGLVLFLRKHTYQAAFFLSLSAYAYPAERVLSLIVIVFLFRKNWRVLAFGLLLQVSLFVLSFTPAGSSRLATLSGGNPIRLYSAYFSPDNLFSKPDPDLQRSFPELSVFYWWMFPLLIIGTVAFFRSDSKLKKLFLLLIFISPIPGAVTKDYFSTLRVLPLFLVLSFFISQAWPKSKFISALLIFVAVTELYSNLVLLKNERAVAWNSGYEALASFTRTHRDLQVVVDNSRLRPSYILLAFYNQTDPAEFQKMYSSDWLKNYYSHTQLENMSFENIEVRPIVWETDIYKNQYLVGDHLAISDSQAKEHNLNLVYKDSQFQIYETQK